MWSPVGTQSQFRRIAARLSMGVQKICLVFGKNKQQPLFLAVARGNRCFQRQRGGTAVFSGSAGQPLCPQQQRQQQFCLWSDHSFPQNLVKHGGIKRRSTSGYVIFVDGGLVIAAALPAGSRLQPVVAQSTAEAEYYALGYHRELDVPRRTRLHKGRHRILRLQPCQGPDGPNGIPSCSYE